MSKPQTCDAQIIPVAGGGWLVFASNFIASGVFFGFILMKLKGLL